MIAERLPGLRKADINPREIGCLSWEHAEQWAAWEQSAPVGLSAFVMAAVVPLTDWHTRGDLKQAERLRGSYAAIDGSRLGKCLLGEEFAFEDPNEKVGPHGWPWLLWCCFSRYLRLDSSRATGIRRNVKRLLGAGADPNVHFLDGEEKESALYGAAGLVADVELTQMLLGAGADPEDWEACYHSAEHLGIPTLRLLCAQSDYSVKMRSHSALHLLDLGEQCFDDFAWMLEEGRADPNHVTVWGMSGLHAILQRDLSLRFTEAALKAGADPSIKDRHGYSAVRTAARYGKEKESNLLISVGTEDDRTQKDLAMQAAISGVDHRPNSIEGELGQEDNEVLVTMAQYGKADAVRRLLEAGMSASGVGRWGFVPVHWAAAKGHAEIVEELLKHNPNLEQKNHYGGTALGMALYFIREDGLEGDRFTKIIRMLIDAGADTSIVGSPTGHTGVDALLAERGLLEPAG